jgi:pimeloyl-ACP methyl ester carboxylesterase
MELTVGSAGDTLPATLDEPARAARGGVVVLHTAEAGQRTHNLYAHVSRTLTGLGVSVLRFDRRALHIGQQSADAVAAIKVLRDQTGDVPMGLWGMGMGAEVAAWATFSYPDEIDFVIAVSAEKPLREVTQPVLEFYVDNVASPRLAANGEQESRAVALAGVSDLPSNEVYTEAIVSWLGRLLGVAR